MQRKMIITTLVFTFVILSSSSRANGLASLAANGVGANRPSPVSAQRFRNANHDIISLNHHISLCQRSTIPGAWQERGDE